MSTTAVPSAAVQKQLKQGKVKKGIFSVIRHLVLALLAFIWLVPIAWLLLTSFSTDKGINFTRFVPESFTMWNYVSIMTQPDSVAQFPRWFMNTLVVACFNCVISTCFVLMVAYAISCCRFKGRKLLQNLSVTVNLFPGVLAMIAVYFVLKYMNLTNSYAGLIMVYAGSSGLGYLICKGFFDTVPVALREAAKLDGASEARIFFQIVIPMSRPILVYTIISSFLTPWTDFVVAKMILNSGVSSDWTVAIGLYNMLQKALVNSYFSRFCAGGVLVAIPISILFVIMQKFYVEGITSPERRAHPQARGAGAAVFAERVPVARLKQGAEDRREEERENAGGGRIVEGRAVRGPGLVLGHGRRTGNGLFAEAGSEVENCTRKRVGLRSVGVTYRH